MILFKFRLNGSPPRKSNARRLVYPGGNINNRPLIIKSTKANKYVELSLNAINIYKIVNNFKTLEGELALFYVIYYSRRDQDLSDELISDILQESRIINDDIQFKTKIGIWDYDNEEPRCLMFITNNNDADVFAPQFFIMRSEGEI